MSDITISERSLVYLRFLNLLDSLRDGGEPFKLDRAESALLDALGRSWAAGRAVTVVELMNSGVADMSPSTVHRRLKSLRGYGLVTMRVDDTDNRIKYVEPTQKAVEHFERLSACIVLSKSGLSAA